MGKSLSIQEAWDNLEDDQRQFDRTVAELKAKLENPSKDQRSVDKPSEGRDSFQNMTKKKSWLAYSRGLSVGRTGILESRHKYDPGG